MLGDDTERGGLCARECREVYGVADMLVIDDAVRVVLNERVISDASATDASNSCCISASACSLRVLTYDSPPICNSHHSFHRMALTGPRAGLQLCHFQVICTAIL